MMLNHKWLKRVTLCAATGLHLTQAETVPEASVAPELQLSDLSSCHTQTSTWFTPLPLCLQRFDLQLFDLCSCHLSHPQLSKV